MRGDRATETLTAGAWRWRVVAGGRYALPMVEREADYLSDVFSDSERHHLGIFATKPEAVARAILDTEDVIEVLRAHRAALEGKAPATAEPTATPRAAPAQIPRGGGR